MADKAIIEEFSHNPVVQVLNNLGIDDEDNIITIRKSAQTEKHLRLMV